MATPPKHCSFEKLGWEIHAREAMEAVLDLDVPCAEVAWMQRRRLIGSLKEDSNSLWILGDYFIVLRCLGNPSSFIRLSLVYVG
jgi:hypothetical protein